MQTKDFKGQDCRGRSFKNQDLTGADFSDCDLRGVDFSGANLTDAKFCNARMGKTIVMSLITFVVQIILAILSILGIFIGYSFLFFFNDNIFEKIGFSNYDSATLFFVNFILLFLYLLSFLDNEKFDYLWWFVLLIIVVAASIGAGYTIILNKGIFSSFIMTALITEVSAGFIISLIVLGGMILPIFFGKDILLFFFIFILIAIYSLDGYYDVAKKFESSFGFIILSIFFVLKIIDGKNPRLLPIRRLIIRLYCLGGTQFSFANLTNTDFYKANLKHARFTNAKFNRTYLRDVKNVKLAETNHTPLEISQICNLLTDGNSDNDDFSNLNLYGLDFSCLILKGINFSHANLCGADLSHTQMTGAILESWNIDTETRLDDIDCRYYYYLENGEQKRMPPEGEEYSPGEFTRIFQKIANTIDFIAHNEMELAAIKLSVEQVRVESGNDDIRVQAIEEKDGVIVVKVAVPKTEDRGVLYHEVNSLKHEYEAKIQSLMTEKHIQIGKIETLKEQLKEQRDDFLDKLQELKTGDTVMGNKITTNVTGSTVHGSVVAAEKIENSFNNLQQSKAGDDVKQLLEQLLNEIKGLNGKIPAQAMQILSEESETLIAEITREQPRKKYLGLSLEGIKEAALQIGEIAKPILEIAEKISPFLQIFG